MNAASLVIAVIALVISGVSVYFVIQRDRRDRLRFEREEEERKERKKARLTAEYLGFQMKDGRRVYSFGVTNGGEAPAMHVALLIKNKKGEVVGRSPFGLPLLSEEYGEFEVIVDEDVRTLDRPLSLLLTWRNARNEPEEYLSEVEIPY